MAIEGENVFTVMERQAELTKKLWDPIKYVYRVCVFFKSAQGYTQSALDIPGLRIHGYGGLTVGLEHPQIMVSAAGPGTSPPRILRDNNI